MAAKKNSKRSSPETKGKGKPSRAPSRTTIQVPDEWIEPGSTKPKKRSTIPVEDQWLIPDLPQAPAPLKPPPLPRIDEPATSVGRSRPPTPASRSAPRKPRPPAPPKRK